MSEHSLNVTCSAEHKSGNELRDTVSLRVVKLKLDDHISAYLRNTKRESDMDENSNISENLIEKVFMNYIIIKQILGNLSWQDKLLCQQVCTTWHSAVQALRKEQLGPQDFLMDVWFRIPKFVKAEFKQSDNFHNEPLVVMTFCNIAAFSLSCHCKLIRPHPCSVPCTKYHALLDVVHKYCSAPKNCINMLKCENVTYMPLPESKTHKYTIKNLKPATLIRGLYIPAIPDVKYHSLNIKVFNNMKRDFIDFVDELSKERIVKGLLIYITDKYLLHPVEDIIFVNYLKEVQPDIPYAFGGCIIEDTIFDQSYLNDLVENENSKRIDKCFVSDNLVSMGFFTIPKNSDNEYNFSMYSLVIESSDRAKTKIQDTINEFAKRVPQFEHSVALKLSCVGRDKKHTWEQNCFRAAFPNTRIIGCYGNGELGFDYPPKPESTRVEDMVKRQRLKDRNEYAIIYSYSTVFVYIGWGKLTPPKG